MKKFVIQKQLIPAEFNGGDPNWSKRQIWVLRLNGNDTVDEFDTAEEAIEKNYELLSSDPTNRIYKIVVRNEDGTYSDFH